MSGKGNIKKFEDYEMEEFLSDEFFVQWVKNPDDNTTHFWEKWLIANPGRRATVSQAAEVIRAIHYNSGAALGDESYVEIFENIIKADEGPKRTFVGRTSPEEKWYSFFSVRRVAVFFLACLAVWAIYSSWPTAEKPIEEVKWITKSNPKGQKTTLRLKDGSLIHLNSNTVFSYPEDFSDSRREVRLVSGEAFFDVEKENRPFTVLMPQAEVEVLGTTFNVNQTGDRQLTVALVEGAVKIRDTLGNQVMLVPSEMLQIDENGKLRKTSFDIREITGWKDKYLVFKNDDFLSVIRKLENWYGVEIKYPNRIPENWFYSGTYYDESLENTLKGIRETSQMEYSFNGNTVEINRLK